MLLITAALLYAGTSQSAAPAESNVPSPPKPSRLPAISSCPIWSTLLLWLPTPDSPHNLLLCPLSFSASLSPWPGSRPSRSRASRPTRRMPPVRPAPPPPSRQGVVPRVFFCWDRGGGGSGRERRLRAWGGLGAGLDVGAGGLGLTLVMTLCCERRGIQIPRGEEGGEEEVGDWRERRGVCEGVCMCM